MEAFGEAAAGSVTVLISGIRVSPIRFYGCSGRFGRPGRRAGDRGGAELEIVKEQGLKPESSFPNAALKRRSSTTSTRPDRRASNFPFRLETGGEGGWTVNVGGGAGIELRGRY